MKPTSFLLTVALILLSAGVSRGAIYWDGTTTALTSGSVANANVGSFSQNNNNGTTTMITAVSPSTGAGVYSGASGTSNFGAAVGAGALSTLTSTYFAVTLTPNSGYAITLSSIDFGSRSTATGPQTLTAFSSIDNYATAIGSIVVANNSSWGGALKNITFSGSSLTGSDGSSVEFRLYGSGVVGTPTSGTATWRIDDISLAFSATPVPEPSTFIAGALVALPFGVHGVRLLRNRKRA